MGGRSTESGSFNGRGQQSADQLNLAGKLCPTAKLKFLFSTLKDLHEELCKRFKLCPSIHCSSDQGMHNLSWLEHIPFTRHHPMLVGGAGK